MLSCKALLLSAGFGCNGDGHCAVTIFFLISTAEMRAF